MPGAGLLGSLRQYSERDEEEDTAKSIEEQGERPFCCGCGLLCGRAGQLGSTNSLHACAAEHDVAVHFESILEEQRGNAESRQSAASSSAPAIPTFFKPVRGATPCNEKCMHADSPVQLTCPPLVLHRSPSPTA